MSVELNQGTEMAIALRRTAGEQNKRGQLYARQCEIALGDDNCRRVQDTGQFGPQGCDRETQNHSGNLCKRRPCFNLPYLKDIHLADTHEVDGISQNLNPWYLPLSISLPH